MSVHLVIHKTKINILFFLSNKGLYTKNTLFNVFDSLNLIIYIIYVMILRYI